MIIFGFDFDNTIINYDKVFYHRALRKKIITKNTLKNKQSVKKAILKRNKVRDWTKLQSEVYSQGINEALLNKEFITTFRYLEKKKIKFYIVSHKTKYPYYGKKINLHQISSMPSLLISCPLNLSAILKTKIIAQTRVSPNGAIKVGTPIVGGLPDKSISGIINTNAKRIVKGKRSTQSM